MLRAHLCPLLIRFLTPPNTSFPLTLRLTRVVFLLLSQFSALLPLESEVFLALFIRVVGDASTPLWMRILGLEIFRGLCIDFNGMKAFFERYDVVGAQGGGSRIWSDLMMALNRISTEKHGILGTGAAVVYGSSLAPVSAPSTHSAGNASISSGAGVAVGMIEGAVEMGLGFAQVAGNVVGNSVGGAAPVGLGISTASMKLQCIDQLDKSDPPPIPETYIYLLALQCLCSLSDGFSTSTIALTSQLRAPALNLVASATSDPKIATLLIIKAMAETSWPALLASLSYFATTALDDDLFVSVIGALQNFTTVCGLVSLDTPREAFLTTLCKFAVPPAVVAHIATLDTAPIKATSVLAAGVDSLGLGSAPPLPVGLSSRNYASLSAVLKVAHSLAGSLGSIWFVVFETLQNVDLVTRANARNKKRLPTGGGAAPSPLSPLKPALSTSSPVSSPVSGGTAMLLEYDESTIQAAIAALFAISQTLDDSAFKWFVGGICRLSGEMVGLPMTEQGSVLETPASALASPAIGSGSEAGPDRSRRRASGISTIRSLVSHFFPSLFGGH